MYLFKVTFYFAFARGFLDTNGKKGYYSLERGREVDFNPDSDGRRSSTGTPPTHMRRKHISDSIKVGVVQQGGPRPSTSRWC